MDQDRAADVPGRGPVTYSRRLSMGLKLRMLTTEARGDAGLGPRRMRKNSGSKAGSINTFL